MGKRKIYIRPDMLVDILKHNHADKYRVGNPIPRDSKYVRYGVDMMNRNRICIVVESDEFDDCCNQGGLLSEHDAKIYLK